jgi:hypothetical protein
MDEEPKGQKPEASGNGTEEAPPPFEPDPELVTYLEGGSKDDAQRKFRQALEKSASRDRRS